MRLDRECALLAADAFLEDRLDPVEPLLTSLHAASFGRCYLLVLPHAASFDSCYSERDLPDLVLHMMGKSSGSPLERMPRLDSEAQETLATVRVGAQRKVAPLAFLGRRPPHVVPVRATVRLPRHVAPLLLAAPPARICEREHPGAATRAPHLVPPPMLAALSPLAVDALGLQLTISLGADTSQHCHHS
jgi:hypothetical protein